LYLFINLKTFAKLKEPDILTCPVLLVAIQNHHHSKTASDHPKLG
jgi:hypothetical protein